LHECDRYLLRFQYDNVFRSERNSHGLVLHWKIFRCLAFIGSYPSYQSGWEQGDIDKMFLPLFGLFVTRNSRNFKIRKRNMDNSRNTGRKCKTCVFPTTTCILNVKWKFAFLKILCMRFRASLNWRWLWVPYKGFFSTLPKVASYSAYQNSIIRTGFLGPLLKHKRLNLSLRMFLGGHTVSIVTYCVTKMILTVKQWLGSFSISRL